jgi:hypothetical protein
MLNCANCETTNDIDAKFCKSCGKTIKRRSEKTGRGFVINEESFAGQSHLFVITQAAPPGTDLLQRPASAWI